MRPGALLVAVMLIVAPAAGRTSAQATRVASIDVAVLDAKGDVVLDLAAKDFEVFIDGSPARIAGLAKAPSEVTVILIFDGTASQPLKRYEVNAALATQWLPSLRTGDRVRVGTLGPPLALTGWLSPDPRLAAASAKGLIDRAAAEPSPLWDAANAAIEALAGEAGAKMVLMLSDGRVNANVLGLDDVADRAIAAGVAVSIVGEAGERVLTQISDEAARIRPDLSLRWLADETGGIFLPDGVARRSLRPQQDPFAYVRELVQTPNRPGPLMVSLTSALRQRYRLSVPIPADGRPRRVEIRVLTPGTTAHWPRRL